MTEIDINALKALLDKAGKKYNVLVSSEDLEGTNQARSYKPAALYYRYDGNDTFMYIEIEESGLSIVREELENRGLVDKTENETSKLLNTEYVCPECDFVSTKADKCPVHQIDLLESTYSPELQNFGPSSSQVGTYLLVGFFVLVGLGYAIRYFILQTN